MSIISAGAEIELQFIDRIGRGGLNEVVAFSPIDGRIAVGGIHGIWLYPDLESDPEWIDLSTTKDETFSVLSLLWSADGTSILASNGATIVSYDPMAKQELYRLEGMAILARSHNGKWFAYNTTDHLLIAAVKTGEIIYDMSYTQSAQNMQDFLAEHGGFFDSVIQNAHFVLGDTQIIVEGTAPFADAGNYGSRPVFDLWTLDNDPSVEDFYTDYNFGSGFANIYGMTSDGSPYAIDQGNFVTETETIPLVEGESTRARVGKVALAPDGNQFAVSYVRREFDSDHSEQSSDTFVSVWDAQLGQTITTFMVEPTTAHYSTPLTWSNDGALIALGLDVYEVATGKLARRFTVDEYELFSQGELSLILHKGADNSLALLNPETQEVISTLPYTRDQLKNRYTLTKDIGYLWLSVRDKKQMEWIRISLVTGEIVGEFRVENPTHSEPVFSPDKDYVKFSYRDIYFLDTGQAVSLPTDTTILLPSFTSDNRVVLAHEPTSEVWLFNPRTEDILEIPVTLDLESGMRP